MAIRRRLVLTLSATLLGSALSGLAGLDPAGAVPASCQPTDRERMSPADINGDALADVAVGVPTATVSGRAAAGAVDIHYRASSGAGTSQRVDESSFGKLITPAAGDRFGAALALSGLSVHNTSVAGCANPVIGVPGAGSGRGAVIIAKGTSKGVGSAGAIRINGHSVGEHFGTAVVADGRDIFISAPYRTVSGHARAGAVDHYRISGSTATLVQTLTENTVGVPGAAETNDRFGEVLALESATRLVIGQPAENVGAAIDAGAVTIAIMSSGTGRLTKAEKIAQDSPGISGKSETGDRFGAAVSIVASPTNNDNQVDSLVAVGVPGETLGAVRGAGMVHLLDVGPSHAAKQVGAVTQETRGFPGGSEPGDQFGAAVQLDNGSALRIGVPGEDLGSVRDAGDVLTATVDVDVITYRPRVMRQGGSGSGNLGGVAQTGARVGAALGRLSSDNQGPVTFGGGESVIVGIPGANVRAVSHAGSVVIETRLPYPALGDSAGPVASEGYGTVLAAVPSGGTILS